MVEQPSLCWVLLDPPGLSGHSPVYDILAHPEPPVPLPVFEPVVEPVVPLPVPAVPLPVPEPVVPDPVFEPVVTCSFTSKSATPCSYMIGLPCLFYVTHFL